MKESFHSQIRKNKFESYLIMFLFIVLIGSLCYVYAYFSGNYAIVVLGIIVAIIYGLVSYFAGSQMVLAMSGAKPASKEEYPYLYHTVEGLALAAGIPCPKCYVINDSALNAFATGIDPKSGVIAVTTGLLNKLNREELEGVIAHEMAHIKNYDIRVMLMASVLVGVVTLLSDFFLRATIYGDSSKNKDRDGKMMIFMLVIGLLLAILAPLIAQLIRLAVSRKREFLADADGAKLTRYPQGLANALKKISNDPDPLVDTANKATAHLYISTPFRDSRGWLTNMFSTHPPINERIKKLENM